MGQALYLIALLCIISFNIHENSAVDNYCSHSGCEAKAGNVNGLESNS